MRAVRDLASRAGGLDGRITDGVNGFSFLPGSDTQLAEIMERCLGNADLWRSMAQTMGDEITVETAWAAHKDVITGIGA